MFDPAQEYDALLQQGIGLSGEDKGFFIRGRLRDLQRRLPVGFHPRRILDFGCGVGDTAHLLAGLYPGARIVGLDNSRRSLEYARRTYGTDRISFYHPDDFTRSDPVDLCYSNGVFHHIPPETRPEIVARIRRDLRPGGFFALFENNPLNPGTRIVMRRIPFDREAQPFRAREAQRLLRQGGFSFLYPPSYLFYFPRPLAFLRRMEPFLVRIPLGAQYHLLAQK